MDGRVYPSYTTEFPSLSSAANRVISIIYSVWSNNCLKIPKFVIFNLKLKINKKSLYCICLDNINIVWLPVDITHDLHRKIVLKGRARSKISKVSSHKKRERRPEASRLRGRSKGVGLWFRGFASQRFPPDCEKEIRFRHSWREKRANISGGLHLLPQRNSSARGVFCPSDTA